MPKKKLTMKDVEAEQARMRLLVERIDKDVATLDGKLVELVRPDGDHVRLHEVEEDIPPGVQRLARALRADQTDGDDDHTHHGHRERLRDLERQMHLHRHQGRRGARVLLSLPGAFLGRLAASAAVLWRGPRCPGHDADASSWQGRVTFPEEDAGY
jgi:hypothetical protein